MQFYELISVIRDYDSIKVIDAISRREYYRGTKSKLPIVLFEKIWKYEVDNVHPFKDEINNYLVVEVF